MVRKRSRRPGGVQAILFVLCLFLSGCLSETAAPQLSASNPSSDSVIVRYTGRRDSTKILSLTILNSDKFHGVAHVDTVRRSLGGGSCDTSMHRICVSRLLFDTYEGPTAVIYMPDDEMLNRFYGISTWANDCGQFDVTAHFSDGLAIDLMFMSKLEKLIGSAHLDSASSRLYGKFLSDIQSQESQWPLGCM